MAENQNDQSANGGLHRFDVLDQVIGRAASAGIFLDVDGVLAPIRPRPDETFVPEATRDLVRRLTERYRLVAAVSGRAAPDAAGLLGLDEVLVVGNHGMELLLAGEHDYLLPPDVIERVQEATAALELNSELRALGVRIENKTASVALHTRGVADEPRAWRAVLEAAQLQAEERDLVMLTGRKVVDLRPADINKGTAVRRLFAERQLRAAVYIGDDRTDIDAFRALEALRSSSEAYTVNVAVVSDESPEDLLQWADLEIAFDEVPELLAHLNDAPDA
ncbi:MAG TPA: trehalose-phosphatase, partial [Thermoleophilia bacterium]|nr:trehalose-phosphatase [Thermoleophilia bacterium]